MSIKGVIKMMEEIRDFGKSEGVSRYKMKKLTNTFADRIRNRLIDGVLNGYDINGKTFIDFGSSSGYMVFRLKELGASRCVGVEGETELVEISNKINDIEKYNDVYFYYKDFISDIDSLSETFDFGIVFSCINSVCSYNDPFFEVPKWLESVGKIVPVLFIEFTEYITNTPWEDEFNTIEITEEQINSQQKSWPTATRDDIIRYFTDKNQESFFKKKTQEMFDNLEVLKSWEHLGISDNNRSIYRLDYK